MINVADYIDNRNAQLWQEIKVSVQVRIEPSTEPNYGCYWESKDSVIIFVTNTPNPASFAHELLHIKLSIDGLRAGGCFRTVMQQNKVLGSIFTKGAIDHVTNCMEHVKMLPYFLNLGYANEDFLSDYHKSRMNSFYLLFIKCQFLYGNRRWAFTQLICSVIAMMSDNNPGHEYSKCYRRIAAFAPELYSAISDFWNEWLAYDITKTDEWNSPIDFWEGTHNFEARLENLVRDKYALNA